MPLIIKNYNPEIADTAPHILGLVDVLLENVDYVESITDIIGFSDIEELKDKQIILDTEKYEQILKDKLLNLNEDNYKIEDYNQLKLFNFVK